MDKPLSQLNAVFKLATEKTLSGSDLLVYLHLFNKFNQAHWTETILVRDVELLKLVNLYDSNGKPAALATIRNAKSRLKKKGFINFKITPAGTEYRLIQLYPMDPPMDPPIDTPIDTPTDPLTRSNIRVREDVKTLRLKTSDNARARACVNRNFESGDTTTTKGGERHDRRNKSNGYSYEQPDYTNAPWRTGTTTAG